MNTTNPFQVPSCLQRAHLQQRRQNRLKKVVIGSVAAMAALLIFLLMEGCMSERAKSASPAGPSQAVTRAEAPAMNVPATILKPALNESATPLAPLTTAATSPLRAVKPQGSAVFYLVKSGDTLAQIARQHRISIQAIMAVNSLNDERLTVGAKLKLPPV